MRQEVDRVRGVEGGEIVVFIYCMREESVFSKNAKIFCNSYGNIN